ncbi:MAG: hypothetical protein ACK4RK_13260 [Gemmataceae bacterium]
MQTEGDPVGKGNLHKPNVPVWLIPLARQACAYHHGNHSSLHFHHLGQLLDVASGGGGVSGQFHTAC